MSRFFHYDLDEGITFHETEDEARKAASSTLETYRDIAGDDGWPDETNSLCFGKVLECVEQTNYIPRPPESEINEDGDDEDGNHWREDHWTHIADYGFVPVEDPELARLTAAANAAEAKVREAKAFLLDAMDLPEPTASHLKRRIHHAITKLDAALTQPAADAGACECGHPRTAHEKEPGRSTCAYCFCAKHSPAATPNADGEGKGGE